MDDRGETVCPVCGEPLSAEAAQASSSGLVECPCCLQLVMPENAEEGQ